MNKPYKSSIVFARELYTTSEIALSSRWLFLLVWHNLLRCVFSIGFHNYSRFYKDAPARDRIYIYICKQLRVIFVVNLNFIYSHWRVRCLRIIISNILFYANA